MMSEGYNLLSEEELDEEGGPRKGGFAKNRRHERDTNVEVKCVKMKRSSVLKVSLILSVLVNLALIGFLLWTHFMPFNYWANETPQDNHVTQSASVNGELGGIAMTPISTDPVSNYHEAQQPVPVTSPQAVESIKYCGEDGTTRLHPPDYVNIFQDLGTDELTAVETYLFGTKEFNLLKAQVAELRDNFIYNVELQTPNKSAALHFLDNKGRKPPREAKAVMFLPSHDPPVVEEYVVGPLPNPTYHYRNPRRDKAIDYRVRQYNNREMSHAIQVVQTAIESKVEDFLVRHFGARLFTCSHNCLTFISSGVSSSFSADRKLWIRLMYQLEFATIHPVGFQFLLNMRGLDSKKWFIEKVWFADRLFDSFGELINKYERGETPKLHLEFPKIAEGETSFPGSLNIKGRMFPETSRAAPRQYEPQGHRYTIREQHVEYLEQWAFDFRMSYAGAIQLYDVKFGDQRIAYEMSLQEISVLYSGANPASMHAQLADSAFGLSRNTHGLVPGVDCPDHATFIPVTLFGADHSKPKVYPNSICIFEHTSNVPARRHKAHSSRSGFYYHGLVDNVLILRTIYVMYNYDYILDFIFHQNGAAEIKVYSTGYILSAHYTDAEKPFGFKVFENTLGSIHHHMFNFKIDIDILGTDNRYETLNFVVDNVTRSWYDNGKPFPQLSYERQLKRTEKEAAYKFNFDTPKYLVFSNNNKVNKFSEKRGYRLLGKGFAKQILPDTTGALNSYTWSRYQMAVTKHHDEEETSSSMHAIFDDADPVVSLQRYLDDDENIVDQDLVAWVTLGMLHLPHTEDIPNTPTTGTDASILLLPYNYFQECPSMGARDAIRIDGLPKMNVNHHGMPDDVKCIPKHTTSKQTRSIEKDIFMSLG